MTFDSISDIKKLNTLKGYHFFERDTMRFFDSSIETGVLYGRFFVTREKNFDGTEYRFTIREAKDDGTIQTIGEFQQFETKEDAIDFLDYHLVTVVV